MTARYESVRANSRGGSLWEFIRASRQWQTWNPSRRIVRCYGIQNSGISGKHVQHLRCWRCATRRFDVLHYIGELFRRHVLIRTRLVLLIGGVILCRCKLIKGHARSGVVGKKHVSVCVFPIGDRDNEGFCREEIFAFIRFGIFV